MIKQFEESARERLRSMKSLQESLSQKDSEMSSWMDKSTRLQKIIEERDAALTKLKVAYVSKIYGALVFVLIEMPSCNTIPL